MEITTTRTGSDDETEALFESREVKVFRTRRGIIALVCTVCTLVFFGLAYISGAVSSNDK